MKRFHIITLLILCVVSFSCEKYLEPELEKQLTIEETFSKRTTTERYLAHVYSFLPKDYHAVSTWGFDRVTSAVSRSDESYFSWVSGLTYLNYNDGSWNPTTSAFHTWSWYYQGINQSTVFMNNVYDCPELELSDKEIMYAEARFLRAFYYFLLIQQYGPVYIWKDMDPDIKLKGENVDRHSLDACIEYVVNEFNEAEALLRKNERFEIAEEKWYGRVTVGAVAAAKSRFLLYMARPLFNGCKWYVGMKNYYGDYLFPQTEDLSKWDKAADAAWEVIKLAEERSLYRLCQNTTEGNTLKKAIKSYQSIYFDKWNKELIFAFWQGSGFDWNVRSAPPIVLKEGYGGYAPSLKLVDTYPMALSGRFPITGYREDGSPVIDTQSGYVEDGFTNSFVHPADDVTSPDSLPVHNSCIGRDARFYASIFFNGMAWIYNAKSSPKWVTFHSKGTSPYGNTSGDFVKVGYLFRRMSNPENNTESGSWGNFSWPFFRLAEFYLNYAEACNEKTNRNETEGLRYWNLVRERAGLNKIEVAYPEIKGNKELFRQLLQKERMIELAFENHRYYDIRTWMIASEESNGKRYGRDLTATNYKDSWKRTDAICTPIVCLPKHHLFPIHQDQLSEMVNMTQNYGW
ncbi:MAG: RagB/SusD family nutrient uptake outer membrane protein [Bacteroidales bacterium]|jgi:hypothetical protein|nr:RagB/SusD family nutrient uptake outer membrane protein [Bacteroidales bacterium]